MKSRPTAIESITIRRATVVDMDKVRYRVYSTPTEFIAVIAESALMAVKVSGIKKPHKIVRDLPTDGVAIEAKKMAAMQPDAARVSFSTQKSDSAKRLTTELQPRDQPSNNPAFRPMTLTELQPRGLPRARILPPEMLSQIIEEHAKAAMPLPPVQPASAVTEATAEVPVPAPELSTKERLVQMADEVFPQTDASATQEEKILSPEDVEKLLNG